MKKFISLSLAFVLVLCMVLPVSAKANVVVHDGNILFPESDVYAVTVNGIKVPVRAEMVTDTPFNVAMFSAEGECEVEITVLKTMDKFKLSPTAYGLNPTQNGNKITFKFDAPKHLLFEMNDTVPLILISTPYETEIPDKNDPNVLYFDEGVHEAGIINLKSNQTVYIASGAVVIGRIQGINIENAKVLGRGILESKKYTTPDYPGIKDPEVVKGVLSGMNRTKAVFFQDSKNCKVDGIGVRNCKEWQNLYLLDKDFEISNMNTMGVHVNNDGIDLDTVENFKIYGNFIMAGDDGFGWHTLRANDTKEAPTRNIVAENNTIYNVTAGNAIRFGSSMETNLWENITIKDTYILKARANAVMLDIQDWSLVKNVNVENVYIEEAPGDAVIHISISKGQYSNDVEKTSVFAKDDYRGHIDGVTIKNLFAEAGAGVIVTGYDDKHLVQNVTLENINIAGETLSDASQITTNDYVKNLSVKADASSELIDFSGTLSAQWLSMRGNWFTAGGMLKQSGSGGASFIGKSGTASDMKVSADVALSFKGQSVGVAGRVKDDKNFYLARLNSMTGNVELCKMQEGTLYILGTKECDLLKAEKLFLDMRGDEISCGINGETLISATDGTFKSGKTGIYGYTAYRNTVDTFTVDNFAIETK
ncbi:MAG: hypothetical protein IJE10_07210 [Clostridia bacterium]|nr:hypothetical protein [Clostridia bacterium]